MEAEGESCTICSEIHKLPEECLSRVISLTSPRDSCRSEFVSTAFRSAAVSDAVWRTFLPSDYVEILARAVEPVRFGSMKQLYYRLCDPILIDRGKMAFYVDRETGKKCFILSARELYIVWGETPQYWRWTHHPESRFAEVAELMFVCWLEIRGKMNSRMLSTHSHYSTYLIYKLLDTARGLSHPLQSASIAIGGTQVSNRLVCLKDQQFPSRRLPIVRWPRRLRNPTNDPLAGDTDGGGEDELQLDHETTGRPQTRKDGWMEILLGEFYNEEGDDGEVDMSLMEINCDFSKSGIVVQGIEIRPKK